MDNHKPEASPNLKLWTIINLKWGGGSLNLKQWIMTNLAEAKSEPLAVDNHKPEAEGKSLNLKLWIINFKRMLSLNLRRILSPTFIFL